MNTDLILLLHIYRVVFIFFFLLNMISVLLKHLTNEETKTKNTGIDLSGILAWTIFIFSWWY